MPLLLKQGLSNLQNPVKLYAQLAIASARSIDSLFNRKPDDARRGLAPNEHDELVKARDRAIAALHSFADELEKRLPEMVDFAPMGEANYNYYLNHVLLLPLDRRAGGNARPGGAGALSRAGSAPARSVAGRSEPGAEQEHSARSGRVPESVRKPRSGDDRLPQGASTRYVCRITSDQFQIRQLPDAFKPTSPGGFMNPPGVYDKDDRLLSSSPRTTRSRRTSTFAPPSKIRGRSSGTKEFPDTFCSSRSRIISRTKFAASMATAFSSKVGRFTARRCSCAPGFIPQLRGAGAGSAALALSRRAHRRRRESAHRQAGRSSRP